ncbi:MAG: ATP-binding protein [Planctomycetes bacterium]|nr:ATP-binding protein [Planctomycetota bacterium]
MQSLANYSPKNLRTILKNRFSVNNLDPVRMAWEKINSMLLQRVGMTRYNEFAARSNIVFFDDETLVLSCPDYNSLAHLKSFYYAALTDAVRSVTNRNTKIVFTLSGLYGPAERLQAGQAFCSHNKTFNSGASAQTLDNFIVGDSNKMAFKSTSYFVHKSGNNYQKLFLHSGSGLGKTHLLNGLYQKLLSLNPNVSAYLVDCEDFTSQFTFAVQNGKMDSFRQKYRNLDYLLMDNIHLMSRKASTQEEFLNTFSELEKKERNIILTSTCPVSEISGFAPKLISRLKSCPGFTIDMPDSGMRLNIINAVCLREGFKVNPAHIAMTAQKSSFSIREMIDVFHKIAAMRNPDSATVSAILGEYDSARIAKVSPEDVCWAVARKMGVGMREIMSDSRSRNVALARHVCMYLARKYTGATCGQIGKFFGGRDHATAAVSCKKITSLINTDVSLKKTITEIEKTFQEPAAGNERRGPIPALNQPR